MCTFRDIHPTCQTTARGTAAGIEIRADANVVDPHQLDDVIYVVDEIGHTCSRPSVVELRQAIAVRDKFRISRLSPCEGAIEAHLTRNVGNGALLLGGIRLHIGTVTRNLNNPTARRQTTDGLVI